MMSYRIGQVAELLGVSVDTVRRWADAGRLGARRTVGGQRVVDGATLAEFVTSLRHATEPEEAVAQSARNRFTGIVTRVVKDQLVAQVEMQASSPGCSRSPWSRRPTWWSSFPLHARRQGASCLVPGSARPPC
jgi:excisionase family DNA binding protein